MVDKLQGASSEPPGDVGVRAGIRPGSDPAGWSPPLPSAQQPETAVHQPEGDQPAAADVTGKTRTVLPQNYNLDPPNRARPDFTGITLGLSFIASWQ